MGSDRCRSLSIAVIGGGVSGSVCAREILRKSKDHIKVTVFDQGRALGGRTSHRRVAEDETYLASTSLDACFAFDHGCQFFRGDDPRFRSELLHEWLHEGWVAEWTGSFGTLGEGADFFGFPGQPPFYCGVGGMGALPCALLAKAEKMGAELRPGVRVARTTKLSSGKWLLSGTSGKAAFHDTKEEEAARVAPDALGEFDAVVVTDVSASMAGWHRASAGIPEHIAARVRNRTRVALFTALVAFEEPLGIDEAAFAAADDCLWFAARTRAKPGLREASKFDSWTLVSTPKYAAAEIERVPMQDPKTGAFRPQEMSYLQEGPCAELLAAFKRLLSSREVPFPKVVYMGGQRWGSAFPAPAGVDDRDSCGRGQTTVEVFNIAYDSAASLSLVPGDEDRSKRPRREDFLADDEGRIYYASDYVSGRVPGVESAALSALDAALHILKELQR